MTVKFAKNGSLHNITHHT